ncbi:hypothetical protein [Ktedonospora formicarum]|uniref:hypothetical protein n=1 Tax=Ktedonospora formicarum TaxID=2778364 RepID=UPI001C68C6E0|nr:hypothetical protein [Ktedonospora formicarum]
MFDIEYRTIAVVVLLGQARKVVALSCRLIVPVRSTRSTQRQRLSYLPLPLYATISIMPAAPDTIQPSGFQTIRFWKTSMKLSIHARNGASKSALFFALIEGNQYPSQQ